MNNKLKQKLEKAIILYMAISWGLALGLAIYYYIIIPEYKYVALSSKSNANQIMHQLNSSNLTINEKNYLEIEAYTYQQIAQAYQSAILPITSQQFGNYEGFLITQSLILTCVWLLI